jgi:O-antigen/teichoic acid export membrane protein
MQTNSSLWKRIGANTLWLALARLGSQVLLILFTSLVARRMGQEGLGAYAFMASVIFLGNVVTTFGTDMLLIREVAAGRDSKGSDSTLRLESEALPAALPLQFEALLVQLFLSALFVGLVFVGAPALPNLSRQTAEALRLYSLALFPMAFYTVFSAILRGYERMAAFMLLNLAMAALQAGLAWLFIHPGSGLAALAWLLLVTQVAVALLSAWFCWTQIPGYHWSWRTSRGSLTTLLRLSAPIAFLGLQKVLYQRMSIYLLTFVKGAAVTGWFSAALRAVEAAQVGHIALLGALYPLMSQANIAGEGESQTLKRAFLISWLLSLALGIVVAGFLFLSAPYLVQLLYGPGFEPAIPALHLLAWTLLPFSINIFLSSQILSSRRERQVALALGVSLVTLVGFDIWWIPRWGLNGACLATVFAEISQAGAFLYLRKYLTTDSSRFHGGRHEFSE